MPKKTQDAPKPESPKAVPPGPRTPKPDRVYYIVNPAGAVHMVDREHAAWRLADPRFRVATDAEIAQLSAQGGNQVFDQPIATPAPRRGQVLPVDPGEGVSLEA